MNMFTNIFPYFYHPGHSYDYFFCLSSCISFLLTILQGQSTLYLDYMEIRLKHITKLNFLYMRYPVIGNAKKDLHFLSGLFN